MNGLRIAITLDDRLGIAFNKRRQSSDSRLIDDLIRLSGGKLATTAYSLPLFEGKASPQLLDDPFSTDTAGLIFLELTELDDRLDLIDEIVIYRWNRHYPSDKKIKIDFEKNGFLTTDVYEFEGSSHEKITREILKRQ